MATVDEWGERRSQKRHLAKESVSAFCRTPAVGVALLADISIGGVAFQYTRDFSDNRDLLEGSIRLDLFMIRPFQNVSGIECEVVYDTVMPFRVFLPGTYQLRRCGVEFSHLSEDQHRRLNSFITEIHAQAD